jgi:hypothetical protein
VSDDLPENVAWFIRHLEVRGFREIDRQAGPMDSALMVFHREPVELRLVKDRSQWSVDLQIAGWPKRDRLTFPLFHGFGIE